jgi:hypothetical protein
MDTLTIVRHRLANGRTIADSDVHKLVAQIDQLKAELSEAIERGNDWCDQAKKARAQRDELQDSFDMRWKADMRAIKKWQAANQGNDLVWPDHADLVVWLMAGRDRLRNLLSLAEGKLSDGRLYVGYGNVGPLHDYATASIIQRARAALKETGHE